MKSSTQLFIEQDIPRDAFSEQENKYVMYCVDYEVKSTIYVIPHFGKDL
jgi:hypothetical protein